MELHLLENRHPGGYVSFGTCWKQGEVCSDQFTLYAEDGTPVPAQHEIAARWPDGSVKWARHSADSDIMGQHVNIVPEPPPPISGSLEVRQTATAFLVHAGRLSLTIPKPGSDCLAQHVSLDGKVHLHAISPVFRLEKREHGNHVQLQTITEETCRIEEVSLEVEGPVLLVVCYRGVYCAFSHTMPFVIRMTLGYNSDEIAFQNTFIYHGKESEDFVRGFGIRFAAALTGNVWNRHVRFGIDDDEIHETVQYLYSYHPQTPVLLREKQMQAEMLPPDDLIQEASANLPVWDHYRLTQLSADSFHLEKGTREDCCMIDTHWGHRAPGSMAVTGENCGILIGMQDFWQRFPSELEAEHLSGDTALCTAWFRSPESGAMDYRHYDVRSYWLSNYEGFPEPGASADGIATTSHCSVKLTQTVPSEAQFRAFTLHTKKPAVYVADPSVYHEKRAFGIWSLPADNTPELAALEKLLSQAVSFYKTEIENRHWYGLYDYGDVMHSYDDIRHCWKYDFGGCAWQNTELVPTYWLWLYFLRTGREDVFTLAEAMSRHCSETDVYHLGPMKGIGSRHNIRHWGCSCKEPRVSMAGHHRPLFYLTGDRRLGDCLDEVLQAPSSIANLSTFYSDFFTKDPEGKPGKLRIRTGPDWAALVSDWMTGYERYGEEKYRQFVLRGLDGIARAPMQLGSGPSFDFIPETGEMRYCGEFVENIHLTLCMGGPEIFLEAAEALDCPQLLEMAADYGKLYLMTESERETAFPGLTSGKRYVMDYVASALAAFTANHRGDPILAARAWQTLMLACPWHHDPDGFVRKPFGQKWDGTVKADTPWIATNYVAQWCLNVILALDLIPSSLPSLDTWRKVAQTDHDIPK